ncbi:MAG: TIGR02444 family protein [Ignavibacteriales bacterium]
MRLWEWAIASYQQEGAPEICLSLQDEHGQCVCLLLWAIWGSPDEATLARGVEIARDWQSRVVGPLREARRNLRTPSPAVDDRAREELREEIMSAEMLAERVLMEALETLAPRASGDPYRSAETAARAWGAAAPAEALRRLTAAVA